MEESSIMTKLSINLREGTVEVEGAEEFVRFIYQDFKESLSKRVIVQSPEKVLDQVPETPLLSNEGKDQPKRRTKRKTAASGEADKSRTAAYKPTFNAQLNLAGLREFYDKWKPENNAEKILLFAVFLRDQLKTAPCSADDIFTCYFTLKDRTKTPEAFAQAFHDTKSRTHFIDYQTLQSISITIAGENYFSDKSRKRKEPGK